MRQEVFSLRVAVSSTVNWPGLWRPSGKITPPGIVFGWLLAIFAFAFVLSPAVLSQQTPRPVSSDQDVETLIVETNLTTILMTATDKQSRFVTNLGMNDIRVSEDGLPQQITVFERETERPLSLTLVFDTSGSQSQTLGIQKQVAYSFLKHIFRPLKDKVAVVSFAGEAILQQSSTSDLKRIDDAINRIEITRFRPTPGKNTTQSPVGPSILPGTAIFDSLFLACLKVYAKAPPDLRRAIILLTDGMDTRSKLTPRDAINAAVYANTCIYGIGIGEAGMVDGETISNLALQTGGKAFFPTNDKQLNKAFDDIEQELRSQYLIGYVPTNKLHDGKRREVSIDIVNQVIAKEKITLAYRNHYYVRKNVKAEAVK